MRMSRRMGIVASLGMNPDSVTVNGGGYINYITPQESDYDNLHQPLPGWQNYNANLGNAYLGVNGSGVPHALLVHFKTGAFKGNAREILVKLGLTGVGGKALSCGWAICSTDLNGKAMNHEKYIGLTTATPPDDNTIICSGSGSIAYNSSRTLHSFSGKGKFLPETWYCIYVWPAETTRYSHSYMQAASDANHLTNTVSG